MECDSLSWCVIFNPRAGRGRAAEQLRALRDHFGPHARFLATEGPGHAEELAVAAAGAGHDVVGAAGGDGTVHEVANGVLRAGLKDVALAVLPVGSANDYAFALGLADRWWRCPASRLTNRLVDVGRVRLIDGRERFCINGLGLGFNGAITLEARRIGHLRGVLLYSLAFFKAMVSHFTKPEMDVVVDGVLRRGPTLCVSVSIGSREGNFLLFPKALIDDGLFEYLHVGNLARWELLRYFPNIVAGNIPQEHPALALGRCQHVYVRSESALTVHLDGELLSTPKDKVRSLEIQILPSALQVRCPV